MNDIDQKMAALNYNPHEVLAYKGEKIESFKKAEGRAENGKYIVIKREKVSISDENVDIGIIDSMVDLTFPGALVLANSNLVENKPDALSTPRKPMQFRIDLPGMEKDALFVVEDPGYGGVSTGIDERLNIWNEKYAGKNSIVARSFYNESMVESESQMLVKFGFGIKKLSKELSIDFKAIYESKISTFIASYRQIFYTVSTAKLPENPSDVFGDEVSWDYLTGRGVNDQNPPALVYKVAYGRTIYVKLESRYTNSEVEAAFKAVMKDANATADARYKNILADTTFTAVVMGGGAEAHNEVVVEKDIVKIKEVIAKYSTCSAKNPGYPVSYSTAFLKDNKVAAINSSTEYIHTTSTEYQNAEVVLKHTGGYVAQFRVEWDEVTYDDKGDRKVVRKGWDGNSKDRTAPFSTTIALQGNSENLCVFAKECTGLAWEWWRTVFDAKNVPLVKTRLFEIYGTTLNQKYKIDPAL